METQRIETVGIRHDLVTRIRREIVAGTYDTAKKWAVALDRLLSCVADE